MEPKLAGVSAAILAGGLGTRLRPVVRDRSKVLAEVNGRPFIQFILDQLSGLGVRSTVLCAGYKGFQLEEALGGHHQEMQLTYSHETSPLGTAGALKLALPKMISDPVLVLNGDSFCTADLSTFVGLHNDSKASSSIMLVHVEDTSAYGSVDTNDIEQVTSFHEKTGESKPGWINAGVYMLSREMIQSIPSGKPISLEKEIFPAWISNGLHAFQTEGELFDIGTPERYERAPEFFRALNQESQSGGAQ